MLDAYTHIMNFLERSNSAHSELKADGFFVKIEWFHFHHKHSLAGDFLQCFTHMSLTHLRKEASQ